MILQPDLEFLKSIGILTRFNEYLNNGVSQMEESDFKSLEPFLTRWGAGEALQELFFYQVNFVEAFKPLNKETLNFLQNDITFFQSRAKMEKMDFSQLQKITFNFGKGLNADLPPDLVKYFGNLIKSELDSEKPSENKVSDKLKEVKAMEKVYNDSKLKIQKAIPNVEAILTGRNKDTIFDDKQSILITYALFYQRGHRLYFRNEIDEGDDDPRFIDSFKDIRVYDILN
jgi:hypothetical protein